jgi:hypothetical protein
LHFLTFAFFSSALLGALVRNLLVQQPKKLTRKIPTINVAAALQNLHNCDLLKNYGLKEAKSNTIH